MCCNQKRTAFKLTSSTPAEVENTNGMHRVKLTHKKPITVTGDITGRVYVFKQTGVVTWVDKRDLYYLKNVKGLEIIY